MLPACRSLYIQSEVSADEQTSIFCHEEALDCLVADFVHFYRYLAVQVAQKQPLVCAYPQQASLLLHIEKDNIVTWQAFKGNGG